LIPQGYISLAKYKPPFIAVHQIQKLDSPF
jgi:hypothetical protein